MTMLARWAGLGLVCFTLGCMGAPGADDRGGKTGKTDSSKATTQDAFVAARRAAVRERLEKIVAARKGEQVKLPGVPRASGAQSFAPRAERERAVERVRAQLAPRFSRQELTRLPGSRTGFDTRGRLGGAHVAVQQDDGSYEVKCVTSKRELEAHLSTMGGAR